MVQSLGILVFLLVDGEKDFQGGLGRSTKVTRQIGSHSDVLLLDVHGLFLGYLSYVVNVIIPVLRKIKVIVDRVVRSSRSVWDT